MGNTQSGFGRCWGAQGFWFRPASDKAWVPAVGCLKAKFNDLGFFVASALKGVGLELWLRDLDTLGLEQHTALTFWEILGVWLLLRFL